MNYKALAAAIVLAIGLALFLAACGENPYERTQPPAKDCITVYSGGVGIGAFKGYRPSVVSSDGSLLFDDDVKGRVKIRGDWILEKCE